jgi:oxygen-independent coproporphyrinogen-3 oxidase
LSGLYIHIPYCRKACTYCNFHFTTGSRYREQFTEILQKEYDACLPDWPDVWETIYFGGGTPSLLPPQQLGSFIEHVGKTRGISTDAEITLEANPEDVTPKNIQQWKQAGINRISVGVQSLSDLELEAMNRAHNAETSLTAVQMLLDVEFRSVNLDLIYGSPWLSDEAWETTLKWAFNCGVQHISAYALTAEPNTRLQKDIESGKTGEPDDEKQARHFLLLQDYAVNSGWLHYEISNICKPGFEAQHNSNYWENKPYLGLGPSAHSFDGKRTRRWNVSDNRLYVTGIEKRQPVFEEELLSDEDRINEIIITRLRLTKGLDIGEIGGINAEWWKQKYAVILDFLQKNLVLVEDNHIKLTAQGRLFSDAISREIMI